MIFLCRCFYPFLYISDLDSSNEVQRIVKTFGCEIPTTVHHSIMSIINEHTLKVHCQKGYEFESSSFSNRSVKKKIRFIRCRNSKILNKRLPKCRRIDKQLPQGQHQENKNLHRFNHSHIKHAKERQNKRNRIIHNKDANHTKGINVV